MATPWITYKFCLFNLWLPYSTTFHYNVLGGARVMVEAVEEDEAAVRIE